MLFTLAACNETTDGETAETPATVSNLVSNGDFSQYTTGDSSNPPYVPTSWTSRDGSGWTNTSVVGGVVNTSAAYEKDKNLGGYNYIPNPGKGPKLALDNAVDDDYVLMLYNTQSSAHAYTSTLSVEANKYYKLTINVRAQAGTSPYIRLRGSAWASFDAGEIIINSSDYDKWLTFTFYIKSHSVSSKSVTIELWNGVDEIEGYSAYKNSGGAVFFDSIAAKEIKKTDYNQVVKGDKIKFVELTLPNPNFEASSSTYNPSTKSPVTPTDYSGAGGIGTASDSTAAPATSSYVTKGIVDKNYTYQIIEDWNEMSEKADAPNPAGVAEVEAAADGFILMINNVNFTSYGYTSSSSSAIRLERGKYYALSVYIKTDNLGFAEYTGEPRGDYFKKTDGSYAKLSTSGAIVPGNFYLAIQISRPTNTGTGYVTRYLSVIDEEGNLFDDGAIRGFIFDALGYAMDSSSESASTLEAKIDGWLALLLPDVYELKEETVDDNTVKTLVYKADGEAVPSETKYQVIADYIADPDTDGKEFDGDEYKDEPEDGAAKSWKLFYLQYSAYLKAYGDFLSKPDETRLYVNTYISQASQEEGGSWSPTVKDVSSAYSTDYRWGMTRYVREARAVTDANENLGGMIRLTSGDKVVELKGISTEGEWKQFTFYLIGNEFALTDLSISFYLGEGGAESSDTHVMGFMFIDSLKLVAADSLEKLNDSLDPDNMSVDASDFLVFSGESPDSVVENSIKKISRISGEGGFDYSMAAAFTSDVDENLIANWDLNDNQDQSNPDGWEFSQSGQYKDADGESDLLDDLGSYVPVDDADISTGATSLAAGELPYVLELADGNNANVLKLTANAPGVFKYSLSQSSVFDAPSPNGLGSFEIKPYTYYRISLWIKTENLLKNSTASVAVYLYGYTEDKTNGKFKGTDGNMYARNELTSATALLSPEDTENSENSGWVEAVFYVAGNRVDSQYIDIEIVFGSGNATSVESLAQGTLYIAYPSMYTVSYKEFNSPTSGAKTYSFTTTYTPADNSVTNGEFDQIDMEKSTFEENVPSKPGVPTSWTFVSGKSNTKPEETIAAKDVLSGIIDIDNAVSLRILDAEYDIFPTVDLNDTVAYPDDQAVIDAAYELVYGAAYDNTKLQRSNSLLMLSSIAESDDDDAPTSNGVNYGYKSASKSLTSLSYYRISVRAKLLDGSLDNVFIYLTSSSAATIYGGKDINGQLRYSLADADATQLAGGWAEYVFYVEVGQSSVSVNVELWLGNRDTKKTEWVNDAIVLFDAVRAVEISLSDSKTQGSGITEFKADLLFDEVVKYIYGNDENGTYTPHPLYDLRSKNGFELNFAYGRIDTFFNAVSYLVDSFDSYGSDTGKYNTDNEDDDDSNDKHIYTPNGWTGSKTLGEDDDIIAGVVPLDQPNLDLALKELDGSRALLYGGSLLGDNVLIIYNTADAGYTYKTSSSKTLSSKTVYEISLYIKTLELDAANKVKITLTLDTKDFIFEFNSEDAKDYLDPQGDADAEAKAAGYTKLRFFINNNMTTSISSAYVSASLGDASVGYTGLVAIDYFTMQKYTGDYEELLKLYTDAYTDAGKTAPVDNKFDTALFFSINDSTDINPEVTEEETEEDPNYNWLYISSAFVGALIIIIVIAYFYRKNKTKVVKFLNDKIFDGKLGQKKAAASFDKNKSSGSKSVDESRKEYDKYKDE
ncbi:MAG: hypothetical protein LBQ40_03500 [Clostridiales bacterium]|jgi:hypothetical protein|nr:hypothetical protein [Clostridiales bacterium]